MVSLRAWATQTLTPHQTSRSKISYVGYTALGGDHRYYHELVARAAASISTKVDAERRLRACIAHPGRTDDTRYTSYTVTPISTAPGLRPRIMRPTQTVCAQRTLSGVTSTNTTKNQPRKCHSGRCTCPHFSDRDGTHDADVTSHTEHAHKRAEDLAVAEQSSCAALSRRRRSNRLVSMIIRRAACIVLRAGRQVAP